MSYSLVQGVDLTIPGGGSIVAVGNPPARGFLILRAIIGSVDTLGDWQWWQGTAPGVFTGSPVAAFNGGSMSFPGTVASWSGGPFGGAAMLLAQGIYLSGPVGARFVGAIEYAMGGS